MTDAASLVLATIAIPQTFVGRRRTLGCAQLAILDDANGSEIISELFRS